MSTAKVKNTNRNSKPKATGKGASDVFQCDNKDQGNENGNVSTKSNSSLSTSVRPKDSCIKVNIPRVVNGKCSCCPFKVLMGISLMRQLCAPNVPIHIMQRAVTSEA